MNRPEKVTNEHAEDCFCQSGWICPECSEEYTEWRFAHEPLARVYREVKKALPEWKKYRSTYLFKPEKSIAEDISNDLEVQPEIELLIQTIIEDIDNDQD